MQSLRRPLSRLEVTLGAGGLFLACFGLIHHWFWAHGQLVDWPTYQTYGDAIVHHGEVPYRDFHLEYPPGALPMFVLPSLAGHYPTTLEYVVAVCGVAMVVVLAVERTSAAFYAALTPVLAGSLVLSRFDVWPAFLTAAALVALLRSRHRLGWALLGIAVSAKLWPFVIVPLALGWSWASGRTRAAFAGLATLAIVVVPFAVLSPHGVFESVRTQADRPLQIESLGASLLTTFGRPTVVDSHGSQGIAGHGSLAALFGVGQWLVIGALWVAFLRGPLDRERLVRYSAACVCAFIAFGKVFSPQFLLWLVPLVPLVRGRRGLLACGALALAFVLTQVWFPLRYFAYVDRFHLAWVVLLRDLVVVGLVAVLALPTPRRGGARSA